MVSFTDKEIKKLTAGKIEDKGPGSIGGLSCVITEDKRKVFYLRYRIKGVGQKWKSVGEWRATTDKELRLFNIISVREEAQVIKLWGRQGEDYLKEEQPKLSKQPIPLRDKLKEFFEFISQWYWLFTEFGLLLLEIIFPLTPP
jgi:hypothetical protein